MILNSEPFEEVDYFKHLRSQLAADGGYEMNMVHRMNEGHRAWGGFSNCALVTVYPNRIM